MRNAGQSAVFRGSRTTTGPAYPTSFAPPASPAEVVRGFDRERRARLVQILALGVGILALVLIPSALVPVFDGVSLVALLIAAVGCAGAYVANRFHRVGEAGYLLLAGGTLGIAWVIAARGAQQGLTPTDLRLYDFFVLPIVLSGVVSNRRAPILFGALTCGFTLVSLLLLPHSQALQLYWDGRDPQTLGSVYDVIAIPIVIQGLTAVAGWLGADSVRRSLLSAMRADELALANERIVAQASELEVQRRRLRDGIAHVQEVHTAFARGNFDVRARLGGEDELQPLAVSLNMLLSQMQRMQREQEQRTRIEQSAHELALALRRLRMGGAYQPPQYTGTAFDEVLLEMVTVLQRGTMAQGQPGPGVYPPPPPPRGPGSDGQPSYPSYPWMDGPGTSRG